MMMQVKLIETNQTFIVANTHLFWNPFRPDIKAFQTFAAIEAITAFCNEVRQKNSRLMHICTVLMI